MIQAAKAASQLAGGARPQLLLVLKPDPDASLYGHGLQLQSLWIIPVYNPSCSCKLTAVS